MFRDVYGVPSPSLLGETILVARGTGAQLLAGFNRLYGELGELAQAMRLEHVFPIAVTSEIADVFAWIMAVANVLPDHLEDPAFGLERALWDQYPGICTYCYNERCSCPNDRVRDSLLDSAGPAGQQLVDELTKLPRRDAFERALAQTVAAASQDRPATLLLVDIDKFKAANDTWGHAFGDEVLVEVAKSIWRLSKSADAGAYRWGGEEFAILLMNRTSEEARAWADRLRTDVSKIRLHTPKGPDYSPTVSVGSATLIGALGESHVVVSRGLFDLADKALYEAKDTGRDRVVARQFDVVGPQAHEECS